MLTWWQMISKIRNLYMTTEALAEKLVRVGEAVEQSTSTILTRLGKKDGSTIDVDDTIKPHIPDDKSLM